jgi:hypothetical protein
MVSKWLDRRYDSEFTNHINCITIYTHNHEGLDTIKARNVSCNVATQLKQTSWYCPDSWTSRAAASSAHRIKCEDRFVLTVGVSTLHSTNPATAQLYHWPTFLMAKCVFITREQSAIFVFEWIYLDTNRMLGKAACFKVKNNVEIPVSCVLLCSANLVGVLWYVYTGEKKNYVFYDSNVTAGTVMTH